MKNDIQKLGKKGEQIAKDFLQKLQLTIKESNWRFGHLEVDIIAENTQEIIFCEVKTRSGNPLILPEQAVNFQKQKNLIRAANYYVHNNNITKEVRFDIISIVIHQSKVNIQHIPQAFTPQW
jgi:putative endonuclease